MSLFREVPPTAGFPLSLNDFFIRPASGDLEDDLKKFLGVPYARVTGSGSSALHLILEMLKGESSKKTVIVPAFVCPLVALAIDRAGLKVKVCDTQPDRFDFNLDELQNICRGSSDILAVIAVHLGGVPVDLDPLLELTTSAGIFLIEDCAQALGAEYRGKKVGSFGDFAFFSLCRGKGLTLFEGGVLVTAHPEYTAELEETFAYQVKFDLFAEARKIIELFGYAIFYRPFLFWFVFKARQNFWLARGNSVRALDEVFSADFPSGRVSAFRAGIGHQSFRHLQGAIGRQRAKASVYLQKLVLCPGVQLISERPGTSSNYPFLTVFFSTETQCQSAFNALDRFGLGVSRIYACALTDYDYLKSIVPDHPCPNAQSLAQRTLTLSTSDFLSSLDIERIVRYFLSTP